jgi:hypothetical protein
VGSCFSQDIGDVRDVYERRAHIANRDDKQAGSGQWECLKSQHATAAPPPNQAGSNFLEQVLAVSLRPLPIPGF